MKYLDYLESIFSGSLIMSFILGNNIWKIALPILIAIYWLKMLNRNS